MKYEYILFNTPGATFVNFSEFMRDQSNRLKRVDYTLYDLIETYIHFEERLPDVAGFSKPWYLVNGTILQDRHRLIGHHKSMFVLSNPKTGKDTQYRPYLFYMGKNVGLVITPSIITFPSFISELKDFNSEKFDRVVQYSICENFTKKEASP